jgi:glycosyltransferase involved in cell wall biosynthesis
MSLSCLYPTPMEPGAGLFVQRRVQHLADLTELQVVAPVPIVQYGNAAGKRIRISPDGGTPVRWDGGVAVSHPRWFYPPLGGTANALWLFSQLLYPMVRLRKQFAFDVLDTHFGHPAGITGSLLSWTLGVPFTMTLRGNEPKHSRSLLGRYGMSWAVQRASRVFTVSERLRQFAIGLGADPRRVKTIPNGIDTAVFFPREKAACRVKHSFALDQALIVSAGALVERKGHHRIIRALRHLSDRGIRTHLAITGGPGPEGQYEKNIRQLVSDLGMEDSVHFLGAVTPEEMAEVMSAADLLCLASTNEGWPNVVHEALGCGTPVVATDVGAVPEILSDSRYGFVVPVDDGAALEKALEEALRTDWDRPAISAWGQARSWQQVAAEVFCEMVQVAAEAEKRRVTRS